WCRRRGLSATRAWATFTWIAPDGSAAANAATSRRSCSPGFRWFPSACFAMRPTDPFRPTCCGTAQSRKAARSERCIRDCGSTSARRNRFGSRKRHSRMSDPQRVAVYTIPSHRSFADALASGLIARFGKEPLGLAQGRILLPNNRAVRAVTDAFVRVSGSGLLLPRLIPIGDPELDERIGGALDRIDKDASMPPAIEPTERLLTLAAIVKGEGTAESLRLAADLARTLDALLVEELDPRELKDAVSATSDLAAHWEK